MCFVFDREGECRAVFILLVVHAGVTAVVLVYILVFVLKERCDLYNYRFAMSFR